MRLPSAILFATTLSLIGPANAQQAESTVTVAVPNLDQFTVRGATVRLWQENGVSRAAVSRDGGRTWAQLATPDNVLHFLHAQFDPLQGEVRMTGNLGSTAQNRLFVVQFRTQILEEYRREIESRGVEVVGYMPENGYLVRADRAVAEGLRGLGMVRWVGDLQVAFKVETALVGLLGQDLTANAGVTEYNIILASSDDAARLAAQIAAIGGEVTAPAQGTILMQANLTPAQLAQVAALDTVLWVDRTPEFSTDMNNARIQGGANYVETQAGLTGQGVRAEITEYFQETHPDFTNFAGRVIVRGTNSVSSHGHCTAGIVGGAGTGNASARGVMPNSILIEGGYSGSNHAGQIAGSVVAPFNSMQGTASWGAAQVTTYTSVSVSMDSGLFTHDWVRTQSQSNTGNQNSRPEAWAKNIVSVGGVRHGDNANPADDNWGGGASIGPASDGRLKPDVTCYYDLILTSDRTGSSGYATGDYYSNFGGTSGATPIVNGYVGLLQQMFTDGMFGNPLPLPATAANRFANRPHSATVKALLCNTARQYSFSGTGHDLSRYKQGWGFPSAQDAYDSRKELVLTDEYDVLSQGQTRTYLTWVPPNTGEYRATMVYLDPAAVANAAIHRINNVDLKVRRLSTGTEWWGNNGLAANNFSTPGGTANDRDTVENVILGNPPTDVYIVSVTAASVVQDGHVQTPQLDVDFSLAVRPTGGYHNDTGMTLDLISTAPGDVRSVVTNVPAGGWNDGFTFFSFNTAARPRFGGFFGIEADGITSSIFALPATPGDVFHFTNAGAGSYPYVPYAFPPALVLGLSGLQVDGLVMLFGPGGIVAMSNADRVQIM